MKNNYRHNKSWPIRLLNQLGVKNDTSASLIIVILSLLLMLIAFFVYRSTAENMSSNLYERENAAIEII